MAAPIPFSCRLAGRGFSRTASSSSSSSASAFRPRLSPGARFQQSQRQQQKRFYSTPPPRGGRSEKIKLWPLAVIVAIGSAGYVTMVNSRKEMPPAIDSPQIAGQLAEPPKSTPTFSPSDVTVIFVLGGPGAGKGTQCGNLVSKYGFTHLSAGDLLRAEQDREGSQFGDLIRDYIKNGQIVPMEVTIQLLENAMTDVLKEQGSKKGRFLIDGFPRKLDQAQKFEQSVCPAKLVLFYDCPEDVMQARLLERGKTSGRADDNAESIKKRFKTFIETSMPVVDSFEKEGKVVKIDATKKPDEVFQTTQKRLTEKLGRDF